MALSARQLRDFDERGWFVLGRVFDNAELADLGAAYDAALAHPLLLGEEGKGKFEYSPLLHVQSDVLCRFATSPKLVAPMLDLLGPNVRLYWDQAVSKPAGATSDVPWHQDNGYTPVEPDAYVTCTLALDPMTRDNGCLWIQPGSHRRGVQPHLPTDYFFQVGYFGEETGEPCELAAGEVLVFSSLTMHRTGPNRALGPRRSWVIQFCHGHARNRDTKAPFDDRLLVARDGEVLAEPQRERPMDFVALARGALAARRRRSP
jgi:ectoine hydroxylase-related dioxygenase (phytanoyl-CoA dioxygenase family)